MANRRRRTKEERIKIKKIKLGIFFVITVLLAVSFIFTSQIEGLLNTNTQKQTESTTIEQIGEDGLKVHFINVGQGDSAVVELPDNKIMMIDAGPRSASEQLINYLETTIFEDEYNKIDYLILTHSDEDHIGSAPDVIEKYDIEYVFRPEIYSKSETAPAGAKTHPTNIWDETVTSFKAKTDADKIFFNNEYVKTTQDVIKNETAGYELKFYYPLSDYYSDVNDFSPLMILSYKKIDFMFTGDASIECEEDFLEEYKTEANAGKFDVEVLKVGHHGSDTSTSQEFLNAIKPEEAVISCGVDNKYGHPHDEVVERLNNAGTNIRRIDESGTILFYVNEMGEMYAVGGYYNANTYYIKWWYIAVSIFVVSFAVLVLGKKIN